MQTCALRARRRCAYWFARSRSLTRVAAVPNRRAAIVGVATSDYPNLPDMSEHQVHAQAAERALADAGLDFGDVDGFATAGNFPMYAVGVCEYLGLRPHHVDETHFGGASFEVLVEHAVTAVEAGICEVELVTYGSVQLSAMGRKLGTGGGVGAPSGPMAFDALWGNTLVGNYALAAQRHMYEYGTTSAQLAAVAVAMRAHAANNPMAQYRDPITVQDVLDSRLIADPLHMLDCCVISDGGGAIVAVSPEVARSCKKPPVWVLGVGEAGEHTRMGKRDFTRIAAAQSGPKAF